MSMKIALLVAIFGVICVQAGPLKNFEELRELLQSMEGHENVKRQPGGGQQNNGGTACSALEELKEEVKKIGKDAKAAARGVAKLVEEFIEGETESGDSSSEESGSDESSDSSSDESSDSGSDESSDSDSSSESDDSDEDKREHKLAALTNNKKSKLTLEKLELIKKIVDNLELSSSTV